MTTYTWTGTTSTVFDIGANWINQTTGLPSGVPGAADTIDLSNAGTLSGTGTVAVTDVTSPTEFTLAGTLVSGSVSILGGLQLAAGSELLAGTVSVGNAGVAGYLGISSGVLAAAGGSLDLTVSSGGTGQGASQLVLDEAPAAHASGGLALGNGVLRAGVGAGQAGDVHVDDGSILGGTASQLIFGQDGGTGILGATSSDATITAGELVLGYSGTGQAILDSNNDSFRNTLSFGSGTGVALLVAGRDGSNASASSGTLQDQGSRITLDGLAEVGEAGQGSVSLTDSILTTEAGLVLGDAASSQGSLALLFADWTDTGNVVVGNDGQGVLSLEPYNGFGTATIHGALLIGQGTGSGVVSAGGNPVTITGETVLGSAGANGLTIVGSTWNAAGRLVELKDSPASSGGNQLVVGSGADMVAGFLELGRNDGAQVFGATLQLGSSASGTAASVLGSLSLRQGATLTALGNIAVASTSSSEATLLLDSGIANLTATSGPALSLVRAGVADVEAGSVLTAKGGILVTGSSQLVVDSATLTALAGNSPALTVSGAGSLALQSGVLTTVGEFLFAGVSNGLFSTGGFLSAGAGSTLTSTAAATSGPAVWLDDGLVKLAGADWTVNGSVQIGGTGDNEADVNTAGGTWAISRTLDLVSGYHQAFVETAQTDTVVSGGTLAAGQTGISAASISLSGIAAEIVTGTLVVGSAAAPGTMSITDGTLVSSVATIHGVLTLGGQALFDGYALNVAAGSTITGSGFLNTSTDDQGSITDRGRIVATGGTLTIGAPIGGGGALSATAGTLILQQAEAAGVGVVFGSAGTIVTPSVADLAGTISGWQPHDAIDFLGSAIATFSYAHGTLSLFDSSHASLGTEHFAGMLTSTNFTLSSDQHGGTLLSYHG